MASLDQAIEQMYASGMPNFSDGGPRVDAKLHRYGAKGHGPGGRAYYKLYDYQARNGKRYVAGFFGMWGMIDLTKIRTDWSGIEPDEYQRLQRSQADQDLREREKRAQRSSFAAARAKQQWTSARAKLNDGEEIPYLQKKRVRWENTSMRAFADGTLLIPLVRYDVTEAMEADPEYKGPRRLAGLQKIAPDGVKRFNKGAEPVGAACRFGPKPKDGELFMIGEGAATVLSSLQCLERAYTAYAAFTSDNLVVVAKILRALFPKSPFLFLADDDAYLEAYLNARLQGDYGVKELYKILDGERTMRGRDGPVIVKADLHTDPDGATVMTAGIRCTVRMPGGEDVERVRPLVIRNPGRTKAREAASAVGNAWVVHPQFADRELKVDPAAPRLTDFNDLHVAEGGAKVVEQLGSAVKQIEDGHEIARALAAGAAPPAAGASGAGGGKGGGDDEPDWAMHGRLLSRFTQIYPSDLAYDASLGELVKIEHMRLLFTTKPIAMWLGSPRKRVINAENVVFDPHRQADPKTTVNLFRGIVMKPQAGKCERLLELLYYLCGEKPPHPEDTHLPEVSTWILKWIAYQVQHIGAKMQTAIVMHGEEGTGKNLLWGAVCKIFGRYGVMITQTELEDRFNEWQSAKLFVIANEVVTRQEMSHQVGRLKNMITEPKVYINRKNMRPTYEDNHMNMVFLSNELQAMKIGPRDRRFTVIRTPNERPATFYEEVAAELAAGGVEALYHHLLELDLGDFKPWTKPVMTEAKEAMIEYGMLPSQLFWRDLHSGILGLPYIPALSVDVFRAYNVWCIRNNHKNPESYNKFTPNFMSLNGVRRIERRVPTPGQVAELALVGTDDEQKLKNHRIFAMGDRLPAEEDEKQRITAGVQTFRKALVEYLKDDAGFAGRGREASQEQAY